MPPVRTAILDDHEIDVAGVSAVLRRFDDRVELATADPDVDVILYGIRERQPGHDDELHALVRGHRATLIVLGWDLDTTQVEWALSCGAHGHLSKTLSGEELVAGLEEIHKRRGVSAETPTDGPCHPGVLDVGLTPRELDVLALITQGLTNQEIADRIYISINSVKTYVRTAYRKIRATRRSQAVSWGVQHGLDAVEVDPFDTLVPEAALVT